MHKLPFALTVTDAPDPDALAIIGSRLSDFNADDAGPANRRPLAIFIEGEDGTVEGGLSGFTGWGWLFTTLLFVPERLRGQGMAGQLLEAAETEARARGCSGAWIDTFNPVARRVYERAGYAVFGELPDFPEGRSRAFLQKPLAEKR